MDGFSLSLWRLCRHIAVSVSAVRRRSSDQKYLTLKILLNVLHTNGFKKGRFIDGRYPETVLSKGKPFNPERFRKNFCAGIFLQPCPPSFSFSLLDGKHPLFAPIGYFGSA